MSQCQIESYQVMTPVGIWRVKECDGGLHWVKLDKDQAEKIDTSIDVTVVENIAKETALVQWLTVYFEDICNVDDIRLPRVCPVVFSKNGFRERVWREIYENLHVGETTNYGMIARICGSEGASQVRRI